MKKYPKVVSTVHMRGDNKRKHKRWWLWLKVKFPTSKNEKPKTDNTYALWVVNATSYNRAISVIWVNHH